MNEDTSRAKYIDVSSIRYEITQDSRDFSDEASKSMNINRENTSKKSKFLLNWLFLT